MVSTGAAIAARDFLRQLVVGEEVRIQRYGRDRYGRTVADLFLKEVPVGELMVSSGHGVVMPRYAHQCNWAREALENPDQSSLHDRMQSSS